MIPLLPLLLLGGGLALAMGSSRKSSTTAVTVNGIPNTNPPGENPPIPTVDPGLPPLLQQAQARHFAVLMANAKNRLASTTDGLMLTLLLRWIAAGSIYPAIHVAAYVRSGGGPYTAATAQQAARTVSDVLGLLTGVAGDVTHAVIPGAKPADAALLSLLSSSRGVNSTLPDLRASPKELAERAKSLVDGTSGLPLPPAQLRRLAGILATRAFLIETANALPPEKASNAVDVDSLWPAAERLADYSLQRAK